MKIDPENMMMTVNPEIISELERMLERERTRLPRVIISILLIIVGFAYFALTWFVYSDMPSDAILYMYGDVVLCMFTPTFLNLMGTLFVGCGFGLLLKTLDKSREILISALLEILRSGN